MIYNLTKYLVDNLPAISFTSNGFKKGSPNNVVSIVEGGGPPDPYIKRIDFSINIMSRADDNPTARKQAFAVYDIINKKFGLTLPADTVGAETFPAVKTWKIIAVAMPGYIGNDENGRPLFSNNYTITTND